MSEHECVKEEDLKKWNVMTKEERHSLVQRMNNTSCPYCRRVWIKFWANPDNIFII
jgi:hypothetical protein